MNEWIIDENSIDHNDLLSARCANKAYPLVRCNDCKYWDADEHECNIKIGWFACGEDWFCADGERKET